VIFWHITPHSALKANRRFGAICRLHLQDRRVSQEINQHEAGNKQSVAKPAGFSCFQLHVGFLLGLVFNPEYGDNMLLRNVGCLATDYMALHSKRYNSS
jgi:hypothetical protein